MIYAKDRPVFYVFGFNTLHEKRIAKATKIVIKAVSNKTKRLQN